MKRIATIALITVYSSSQAAVLATFNFDDDTTGFENTTIDPIFATTSVGDWTPSIHDGGSNETGGLSTSGDNYFVRSIDGTINSTNSTSSTTYASITINVSGLAVGDVLNITNVSYDHFATGNSGSLFFSRLYSDLTGLTGTGDGIANQPGFTDNTGGSPNQDLSGIAALQGLENGDSVEFRLYLGDNTNTNSRIHRIDNFVIDGTVTSIPEPSSALLSGIALLGLLRRRR